jgi:hypothetical protein
LHGRRDRLNSKTVLIVTTIIGLCFVPILFRKKYIKSSLIIFVIAGVVNALLENYLVAKDYVIYPVRYFPEIFKYHVMYDFLVCPLISVAYCQTSSRKNLKNIYVQGLLYSGFQTLLEYIMVTKTDFIQYNNWDIWHTFVLLIAYKIVFIRGIWELLSNWSTFEGK